MNCKDRRNRKKRKGKKIILITIGVIVLLIIGLLSLPRFLNLFAKDIAPINDSDLQLQKISVADSDNAYFDLAKLSGVIYQPEGKLQTIIDMVVGKIWDSQIAEDIVLKNSQAFAYFTEAARKPKYQNPELADPINITPNTVLTSISSISSWRPMARLSAVRAMYLAKQGRDKEALGEALNSVNIGQKIQESQASLIEYFIAMAMKGIGLHTVQKIIPSSKLTSGELKQYIQAMDKFYQNESGLITALKGEYYIHSWAIDSIVSEDTEALKLVFGEEESQNPEITKKTKDNYYFKPNKTKLLFAEDAKANIKRANQFCGEIKDAEVKPLTPINLAKLYAKENAIGKILYDVMAISLTGANMVKCQEDLLVGATQAMIAIKAFKNDTNNYPNSLNELVSNYLSSVPQDPFDGKSLKYSAAKKIIYSVGEDLQDSGGSVGDDWRIMADPTFVINF